MARQPNAERRKRRHEKLIESRGGGLLNWLGQPKPHYGWRMTLDYMIVGVFFSGIIGVIGWLTLH